MFQVLAFTQAVNICFKVVGYHRFDDSGNVTKQSLKAKNYIQRSNTSNSKFMWRVVDA